MRLASYVILIVCIVAALPRGVAYAQVHTPMNTGFLGLNVIPSARMGNVGDVRAGAGFSDPYMHGYMGVQIAAPLFISLRQSALGSNPFTEADALHPGMDIKLRIAQETRARPQIAIGAQSVIGHTRMAGEFITASKRWHDFDFTLGAGWGRFAEGLKIDNPLKGISNHFARARNRQSEIPNAPDDWFTGRDVGIFGGVEYFTPLEGLSLKADYGGIDYTPGRAFNGFDAPPIWSVGAAYNTPIWRGMDANFGIAAQGFDRVLARMTLRTNLTTWADYAPRKIHHMRAPLYPKRTNTAAPGAIDVGGARENMRLYHTRLDTFETATHMVINPYIPTPKQLGRAAVTMANHSGLRAEFLRMTPTIMGLRGASVTMMRADLERALARTQGSAAELWQSTTFDTTRTWGMADKLRRPAEMRTRFGQPYVMLDNKISLAEEDSGILYRTSLIGGIKGPQMFGFLDTGAELRLNIHDNLSHIRNLRPAALLPVRSDEDLFADRRIALDRSWVALTHSFKSNLHVSLMGGYLEEMYAGVGGEVLYRPFKSRFAIGMEGFQALKRDPSLRLNLGLNGDMVYTGHVNGWYDIPQMDATAHVKIGQFLNTDRGVQAGLTKRFKNGVRMDAFAAVTDGADFDLFGGTTHVYNGVRLTLPLNGFLGGVKYTPDDVSARITAAPFGRDMGQVLDNPIALYETTQPLSYKHITDHWGRVVQ